MTHRLLEVTWCCLSSSLEFRAFKKIEIMSKFRKKKRSRKKIRKRTENLKDNYTLRRPKVLLKIRGQFFQMELLCPSNKEGKTVVVLFLFLLIGFFSNDP